MPIIDEAGLKGYEVTIWNGFFAPKDTPKDIVTKLNQALLAALGDDKIRARLTELAVDLLTPQEATPDALRAQLKASVDKWVPDVQAAGVSRVNSCDKQRPEGFNLGRLHWGQG